MTAVFNFTNGGSKYCLKSRFLADFKKHFTGFRRINIITSYQFAC